MNWAKRLVVVMGGMLLAGGALAQAWPTKPINLLIPFPPGTGNDIIGRVLGAEMSKILGQPVVPDNRAGVSGNIAMEATSKSAPDGYTLVVGSTSYSINLQTLKGTVPLSGFTPVALVGTLPYTLVIAPELPAKNVKELIAVLKSKSGQYNAATGGPTGTSFFLAESFKKASGVPMEIIAYKGTTEAVADLLVGRTHILFAPMPTSLPYHKSGKLHLLGVTGSKRNVLVPDVQTFTEAGFPMLDVGSWYAIMGPAGIPRAIVTRLNQAVNKAMGVKDVQEKLGNIGVDPNTGTPEELDAYLKKDASTWADMVKDSGIKAQ
jgi:tripartite-type tricarboxylate transporter receptor subunit TctC